MKSIDEETLKALQGSGDALGGLVVLSGLGAWAGLWLDGKFHSAPLWVTALSLLGMCLGLARIIVKANAADKAFPKSDIHSVKKGESRYTEWDDKEDRD